VEREAIKMSIPHQFFIILELCIKIKPQAIPRENNIFYKSFSEFDAGL